MVELKLLEFFNTVLEIVSKSWPAKKTTQERAAQLATAIRSSWNRAAEDIPAVERVGLLRHALTKFDEIEARHTSSSEAAEIAQTGAVRGITREQLRGALLTAEQQADESRRSPSSMQACLDRLRHKARVALSRPSIDAYSQIAEDARECLEYHATSDTANFDELRRRIVQAKKAIIGAYAD
jgi:hypothetical protein